jgi:ribonuclease HI
MNPFADKLTLKFDGSCEPRNPGGVATYGYVITAPDGSIVKETGGLVCKGAGATNNVAEYSALGFALRFLGDEQWLGSLDIFGDSQLVIKQLTGEWACNKEHLQRLRARCLELLDVVAKGKWTATWIPREQNKRADKHSQEAYERETGLTYPERRKKTK